MATNEKLSKYDSKDKVDGSTYQILVGSLICLTNSLPNIVHVVSIVSQFMNEPSTAHFAVAKRIFRYNNKAQGIMVFYTRQRKMQGLLTIQTVIRVDA